MMWLVLVLALLSPSLVEAACGGSSPNLTAASPSRTDVSDCITAAVDGDTITVPAGSASWSSALTVTDKEISIIGAGIDVTTITGTDPTVPRVTICLLSLVTSGTQLVRVSGFTFTHTACAGTASNDALIRVGGTNHNVRIDHNKFDLTGTQQGVYINDDVRGVGDHNEFLFSAGSNVKHMTVCQHDTWGGVGAYGDNSWASDSTWGTADNWYWEDNLFNNQLSGKATGGNGRYATDDSIGCRVVYRFNTFVDTSTQTHGTETNGRPRGQRHGEYYRNEFTNTMSGNFNWPSSIAFRGGTARVFDNADSVTGVGSITRIVDFNTYRREPNVTAFYIFGACGVQTTISSITRVTTTATATTTGEHYVHAGGTYIQITGGTAPFNVSWVRAFRTDSTHFTYTVADSGDASSGGTPVLTSPFDHNDDSTGYRCLDQFGAGKQTPYYSGDDAAFTPKTTPTITSEPAYIFHNLLDAALSAGAPNAGADVIISLRDYYNENTSYNGTTQRGVYRAASSSPPTACTAGDVWWKTDLGTWNTSTTETYSALVGYSSGADGELWECTVTGTPGTWAKVYEPYTYPHPLAGGSAPINTPPGPPTNLSISQVMP